MQPRKRDGWACRFDVGFSFDRDFFGSVRMSTEWGIF